MCCTTLTAMQATMATTQFTPVCCDVGRPWPEQESNKRVRLGMNWVVVTDEMGNRRPRMRWGAGRQ